MCIRDRASAIPVLSLFSVIEGHLPAIILKGQARLNSNISSVLASSETNIFNPSLLNANALVWSWLDGSKSSILIDPSLVAVEISYAVERVNWVTVCVLWSVANILLPFKPKAIASGLFSAAVSREMAFCVNDIVLRS